MNLVAAVLCSRARMESAKKLVEKIDKLQHIEDFKEFRKALFSILHDLNKRIMEFEREF